MITVNYHPHTPMEQDILVGILLVMYMGNDIPKGEKDIGFKWCPLRNTLTYTSCTVTRVSARHTTRGHYRQDIPLGTYDRKQQRWTLRGNHTEVDYLMKLIRKGDDVSLATLEKIRTAPWKEKPPNVRETIRRYEERDDPWENIPQEDCTSEASLAQSGGTKNGTSRSIRGSGFHSSGLEEHASSGNRQHTGDPQAYRQDSLEALREKDNGVI